MNFIISQCHSAHASSLQFRNSDFCCKLSTTVQTTEMLLRGTQYRIFSLCWKKGTYLNLEAEACSKLHCYLDRAKYLRKRFYYYHEVRHFRKCITLPTELRVGCIFETINSKCSTKCYSDKWSSQRLFLVPLLNDKAQETVHRCWNYEGAKQLLKSYLLKIETTIKWQKEPTISTSN